MVHNGRQLIQIAYHVLETGKPGTISFYKGKKNLALGIPFAKKIVNAFTRLRHDRVVAFVQEMGMGKMFKLLGLNE